MEQNISNIPESRMGDFWIFWTGQAISQIGSALTSFALPLLVYNLTGSALDVGWTMAATLLPYALFGLVGGAWIDRVNRKVLMIGLDIARTLLLGFVPLMAFSPHFSLWWIYLITFLNSLLSMVFSAASFIAIANLVKPEELVKANGRVQTGTYGAYVIGPLLATLILNHWSIQAVLWCDALTFLASAGSLALIRASFNGVPAKEQERAPFGQSILEGLRYVFSQPVIYLLGLLTLLANIAIAPIAAQLVVFATRVFAASNAQVGAFATALGVGGMLATLAAGHLKRRLPYGVLLLGSILLAGTLTIVLALTRNYWIGVVLWGCIFGLFAVFNVAFFSILQGLAPDHLRGRVILSTQLLAALVAPLAIVLSGLIIDQVKNIALVFGVLGGLVVLIVLAFIRSPLAHVERFLPASPSPASVSSSALEEESSPRIPVGHP